MRKLLNIILKHLIRGGKRTHHWWRKLSKRTQITIAGVSLLFLFLVLPNIHAGLKVLGFVERDFIQSNAGALFETNPKVFPYFRGLIGSSVNTKELTTGIELEGGRFDIGFISSLPKTVRDEFESTETPRPDAIIPDSLIHAEDELASIAAQIENINTTVTAITTEVSDVVASNDQSFFGPYEKVTLKTNVDSNAVSFYLDRGALTEVSQFQETDMSGALYLFTSQNYSLIVNANQSWDIMRDGNPIMRISHKLVDGRGGEATLPILSDRDIQNAQKEASVSLSFPTEWLEHPDRTLPIKLIRTYERVQIEDVPVKEIISKTVGVQLSDSTVVVGQKPTFITKYQSGVLYWDAQSGEVMYSVDGISAFEPLFNEPSVTGLDCFESECVYATDYSLFYFEPGKVREREIATRMELLEKRSIIDGPIKGISVGGSSLLRTSFINPSGTVYRLEKDGQETRISESHTFPEMPTMSDDGSYYSFWADGQLYYWQGNDFSEVVLPDKPLDLALSDDNKLYFIVPFAKTKTHVLARITPGLGLEIAQGIAGELVSIEVFKEQLFMGFSINQNEGALLSTTVESIRWVSWDQFIQ